MRTTPGTSGGVDIPCADKLGEMCEKIDDLPGVSTAFKQCMKGRCACGGSSFSRLEITCDDQDSCGPCAALGDAGGCSLGGSQMWYCGPVDDEDQECLCVNIIFHEMSHACGALDQTGESYRIGSWFEDQCSADPVGARPVRANKIECLR